MELEVIFEKLWEDYKKDNPSVNKMHQLLHDEGEIISNDHIAIRTFDLPGMNIEYLEKVFLQLGYVAKGTYYFEKKQLRATHYEHITRSQEPKIFISELITESFGTIIESVANEIQQTIMQHDLSPNQLILAHNLWKPISYKIYTELKDESEYAAWFYVFGFRANHFTININNLYKHNTIEKLNDFLKSKGLILNSSGGEIKGSRKQLLQQSSTMADKIKVEFIEGTYTIPCCYYEFAQRYRDQKGKLFTGFIADSADKIFESTDSIIDS